MPETDLILRIEVEGPTVRVTLVRENKILAEREVTSDRTLATQILSAIEEMCAAKKIDLSAIAHIDLQGEITDSSAGRTATIVADMLREAALNPLTEAL